MYCLYASLFQRPKVWMVVSGTPFAQAVVAALILNEWPLYREQSIPAVVTVSFTIFTSRDLVRCLLSLVITSGPGAFPLETKKGSI